MNRKTIFLVCGAIAVVAIGAILYSSNSNQQRYQFAAVRRAPIVQEVLASGNVESPTAVNLHFKSPGRLVALDAAVNQKVKAGQVLARVDESLLQAQLREAQGSEDAAVAALNKLQAGATPQSIALSKASLTVAQQALQNSYTAARNTLADAFSKGNDAVVSQLSQFFSNSQSVNPQLTFSVLDGNVANNIISQRVQAGTELTSWQGEMIRISDTSTAADLDQSLVEADAHLIAILPLINSAVTAVADNINLSSTNAATYRTNASTGLTELTAAISEIRTLEQTIASQKANVAQARAALDLVTAGSTKNDTDAAQALISQANARVAGIQAQMQDLELRAPSTGVVTDTNGQVGEIITPDKTVISILPDGILQITANVSEDNIVSVREGNHARIQLDAFPAGTSFSGHVSSVDPAQTIIGGAVYYQTKVLFDQNYPGIKPGMTANTWIEIGSANSTLVVPASALQQKGTSTFVQMLENGNVVVKNVTTGLRGADGMVEIISGISEGDLVVTGSQ